MIKLKTFPWADLVFDDIETIESTGPGVPRIYKTPDGHFPSMTSVLSALKDEVDGLQTWRDRIGHKEADKITKEAGARGNALHDYNELYLQNKLKRSDLKGQARTLFNRVKPYLDEIELVIATEVALWSKKHQYAGRVDCMGMLHDKIMTIDHKNSRNPMNLNLAWNRQKIFKYMLQCTGYSIAFNEMTGIMPSHGCLIVGNHLTSTSDRFIFELDELVPELELVVGAYHGTRDQKDCIYHDDKRLSRILSTMMTNG